MSKRRLVNRCLMGAVLAVPATLIGIYSLGFAQEPPSAAFPSEETARPLLRVAQAETPPKPNGGNVDLAALDVPGGMALDPMAKKRKTAGITTCGICHNKAGANQKVIALEGTNLDDGWCLLNEIATWGNMDKHFSAYAVLLSDRSKRMAEIMGIMEDGKSVIHRDQRCLACHSGMPLYEMDADANGMISEELTKNIRLNRGVSCEGCHGPSDRADLLSDVQGWKDAHYSETWRYLDPKVKAEKFGYFDVRSPVARTRMCASCHIGNAKEGRVVTHEMYAAGHPPLPGFELETFSDQEPEHWRNFRHKPAEIREKFLEQTKDWRKYDWSESTAEDARDMLIAACVNLSEYLKVTSDLADPEFHFPLNSDKWSKETWPELAQFACYACHHDLQAQGWRIQRKPVGVPGRPPLYEWPEALVHVAMRSAKVPNDTMDTVAKLLLGVRQASVDGPFGNREKLQSQSRELAGLLDQIAMDLENSPFTQKDARQVLANITAIGQEQIWDYDSARQLVWAYRIVYQELIDEAPSVEELYKTNEQGLTDVPGWYDDSAKLDEVQEVLNGFQDILLLSLREGRIVEKKAADGAPNLPFLEWDADKALSPIGSYDPVKYKELMSKLEGLGKKITVKQPNDKNASE